MAEMRIDALRDRVAELEAAQTKMIFALNDCETMLASILPYEECEYLEQETTCGDSRCYEHGCIKWKLDITRDALKTAKATK